MAHGETTNSGETIVHSDMNAHVKTYGSVMNFLKWGTVVCALVAGLVVWLIAA